MAICFVTLSHSFCCCCCSKQHSDFWGVCLSGAVQWLHRCSGCCTWCPGCSPLLLGITQLTYFCSLASWFWHAISGNPVFIERLGNHNFLSGVAELDESICVVPLKTLRQVKVWASESKRCNSGQKRHWISSMYLFQHDIMCLYIRCA